MFNQPIFPEITPGKAGPERRILRVLNKERFLRTDYSETQWTIICMECMEEGLMLARQQTTGNSEVNKVNVNSNLTLILF